MNIASCMKITLTKSKKLGAKIRNFSETRWNAERLAYAQTAVLAKFSQNLTLKAILVDSGDCVIAESSSNSFWGTGLYLHDRNALNKSHWKNRDGGAMCGILKKVRREFS